MSFRQMPVRYVHALMEHNIPLGISSRVPKHMLVALVPVNDGAWATIDVSKLNKLGKVPARVGDVPSQATWKRQRRKYQQSQKKRKKKRKKKKKKIQQRKVSSFRESPNSNNQQQESNTHTQRGSVEEKWRRERTR